VIALALGSGLACALIPWDTLPARWLHALPIIGTIEVALAVWTAGTHGEMYDTYYVFVTAFAAYAFSSRRAIAVHVTFAATVLVVPLLALHSAGGDTPAKTLLGVVVLVVIAAVVTMLREGVEQRQRELEKLTLRDPLTGVGNYRLLSQRLDYEISRHSRSGRSLTVMLLDLDGFKTINDTFGHPAGDRILCEVARALASSARAQDTLARQGGDEFSILAPDTTDEQAASLAARARAAVAAVTGGSVGWATYPTQAEDPETLLDGRATLAHFPRNNFQSGCPTRHTET
jgi:diguanylate cyclase (GGDEF)-like protein